MSLLQITVLAIVQGTFEFLPISSSGHLILIPVIGDWPDQGRTVDVAVHIGTLLAVLIYFWRDVGAMLVGLLNMLVGKSTTYGRLALYLIISTLPIVIAGFLIAETGYYEMLRSVEVIAWATIVFGIVLFLADRSGMTIRRMEHMTALNASAIGIAQVLSLIPGTSRSGITMAMGRFLGFEPQAAARFSMLMSIPTIIAAGALEGRAVYMSDQVILGLDAALAIVIAFVTALASIAALMAWLRHAGFTPFVIYRLGLGGILLWWIYLV